MSEEKEIQWRDIPKINFVYAIIVLLIFALIGYGIGTMGLIKIPLKSHISMVMALLLTIFLLIIHLKNKNGAINR